ncbi:helix-turn-helix transcriptional regulator [Nocardia cyriacigeorgica]|uniref:helix-turn-helix transcriptional regulator n=1 Tax=Nocardia cyriacigeorgica TaxID=135487 RepID=UPI002B4B94DC|nr:LuxR C-terminal-related transcriptional regulator [Nocardia cyriacigeorgica]
MNSQESTSHRLSAQSQGFPAADTDLRIPEFLGRESETRRIEDLLLQKGIRLLTLTGTVGVGKSRLCREVLAGEAFRSYDHKIIDLSDQRADGKAWQPILAAFEPAEPGAGERPIDHLVASIGSADTILVLDNCDHVSTEISHDIMELLSCCPALIVLTTSRVPLNLYDECVFCVPPLALDAGDTVDGEYNPATSPASELILSSIDSHYRGAAALVDRLVLDEIAHAVDGIPLALEIAACTIGRIGPAATLRAINASTELEGLRFVNIPKRHRTVWDATAWSVNALRPSAFELLLRMSECVDVVDIELANLLGGTDRRTTTDLLALLVQHSLIQPVTDETGHSGFRLDWMVYSYCRRTLADDPARAARVRATYLDSTCRLAEELGAPGFHSVYGRGAAETVRTCGPDLLAALAHLFEGHDPERGVRLIARLGNTWVRHGYLAEAEALLESVLAAQHAGAEVLVQCRMLLACAALRVGRHQRAIQLLDSTPLVAASPNLRAMVALLRGEAHRRAGDYDRARAEFDSALDDPPLLPRTYRRWVELISPLLGDATAPEWRQACQRVRDLEPSQLRSAALNAIAEHRSPLDAATALRLYREVLETTDAARFPIEVLTALDGCVRAYTQAGPDYSAIAATLRHQHDLVWARFCPTRPITGKDAGQPDHGRSRRGRFQSTLRTSAIEELREAVAAALAAPIVSHSMDSQLSRLTRRQLEVAQLVGSGMTNRMIASRLGIAEWTVVNHLRQVMTKLDCPSRLHVALLVEREPTL